MITGEREESQPRSSAHEAILQPGEHLAQTVLIVGLVLRELAGLLRHVIQLLGGVLMLHPIQDVARFIQALHRALLSGIGLIGTAVLLILGLQTRLALIVGGLMMTALTFGTMQTENFQNAWLQLTYALVFFVVLALRSWNLISLDALIGSNRKIVR